MHSLPELRRLNAIAADDLNDAALARFTRRTLHSLVRDSIRSIEEQRPLSDIQMQDIQRDVSYYEARGAEMRDFIRMRSYS